MSVALNAQQPVARSISFPVTIKWPGERGVTKYRLQIARDEKFADIFFDGQVNSQRYKVSGLPPGYYFWRVAASGGTRSFEKPVRFFISGGTLSQAADQRPRRSRNLQHKSEKR
ncbi:MAG TPA: hypothetical protein VJT50_07995 [Pyrinomonadaceae bacterium]|nr:hypothetical protein [Pyrinomonadaceae bacterium]